jgi:hypothetical protein
MIRNQVLSLQRMAISAAVVGAGFQAQSATIKQLVVGEQFAVAELTSAEQVSKPYFLLSTFQGKQCQLKVLSLQGNFVKVSTKECPFKDQLTIGQALEMPLINEPIIEKKEEPPVVIVPPAVPTKVAQEEQAPENLKRSITDLHYLPYEGQSQFSFSAASMRHKEDITVSGANFGTAKYNYQTGNLFYAYGLSDRMAIGVSEDIVYVNEEAVVYGPASGSLNGETPTFQSDGIADPTIGLDFRLLEQSQTRGINFDIRASYLTKFQEAKGATRTENGNAARGGDGISMDFILSRNIGRNSVKVAVNRTSYGTRTRTSGTTKAETTGGNSTQVDLAVQSEITSRFVLGVSCGYYSVASTEQNGSGQPLISSSFGFATSGVEAKLVLVPESTFVNLRFDHRNSYYQNASLGTVRLEDDVSTAQRFSIGLGFVF